MMQGDVAGSNGPAAHRRIAVNYEELPQPVREALEAGRLIEAIKLLRAETGLGLKDAKDIVEGARGEAKINGTGMPPAPSFEPLAPEKTPWPKIFVIAGLIAALVWFFGSAN